MEAFWVWSSRATMVHIIEVRNNRIPSEFPLRLFDWVFWPIRCNIWFHVLNFVYFNTEEGQGQSFVSSQDSYTTFSCWRGWTAPLRVGINNHRQHTGDDLDLQSVVDTRPYHRSWLQTSTSRSKRTKQPVMPTVQDTLTSGAARARHSCRHHWVSYPIRGQRTGCDSRVQRRQSVHRGVS